MIRQKYPLCEDELLFKYGLNSLGVVLNRRKSIEFFFLSKIKILKMITQSTHCVEMHLWSSILKTASLSL